MPAAGRFAAEKRRAQGNPGSWAVATLALLLLSADGGVVALRQHVLDNQDQFLLGTEHAQADRFETASELAAPRFRAAAHARDAEMLQLEDLQYADSLNVMQARSVTSAFTEDGLRSLAEAGEPLTLAFAAVSVVAAVVNQVLGAAIRVKRARAALITQGLQAEARAIADDTARVVKNIQAAFDSA